VLIASPEISDGALAEMEESIRAALLRGVTVDILWAQGSAPAVDRLERLQFDTDRWRFRFNRRPSRAPLSAVILDPAHGGEGVVGATNWLGERDPATGPQCALRLREPELVGQVCSAAASWWRRAEGEAMAAAPARWAIAAERMAASSLSHAPAVATGELEMMLGARVNAVADLHGVSAGRFGAVAGRADDGLLVGVTPDERTEQGGLAVIARGGGDGVAEALLG
jgi:hypothetical protein